MCLDFAIPFFYWVNVFDSYSVVNQPEAVSSSRFRVTLSVNILHNRADIAIVYILLKVPQP
jgi:hypothetical protein